MAIIKPLQSITLKNDNGEDIKYDVLTRSEVSGILGAIGVTTESTASGNPLTLASVELLKAVKENGTTAQDSTTGKNLLDTEAMVAGILNASGVVDVQNVSIGEKTKASITWTSSSTWRGVTSDYIPVTAGGHYYLSLTETVSYVIYAWYDTNKTFISRATYNGSSMQSVTAPNNAAFVRYSLQESTVGTFTYHNIQLESGSSATAYEPYTGGAPAPSPSYPQGIYGLEGYSDAECTTLETDPYADRYYKVDVTVDGVTKTVRTAEKIAPLYDGDYLDFVSGVVHREKAKTTIPANDTWSWHNTSVFAYHDITGAILTDLSTQGTKEVDCDIAKGVAWTQRAQSYWTASLRYGLSSVALKSPSVTTYAQFQAATANLPITVVYQLDTPTDTTTDLTADLSDVYGNLTLNGNGTMDVTYRHG